MKIQRITYLSLGTNQGNKIENLQNAIDMIAEKIGAILNISSVYKTASWGFDSNDFYNICLKVSTYRRQPVLLRHLENPCGWWGGEVIKAEEEEEEDNSGTNEICHIRGGGEVEDQSSGQLTKVKLEAEGFFASDDEMATDGSPMKYFVRSSTARPAVDFGINTDYSFASHSGDFDLFEGELLRSYACDEIFVTPSKESGMKH